MILRSLLLLGLCLLAGSLAGTIVSISLIHLVTDLSLNNLDFKNFDLLPTDVLRIILGINHLFMFSFGALLYYIIDSRQYFSVYFGFRSNFNLIHLFIFLCLLWLSYPVSSWIVSILHEWPHIREMEESRKSIKLLENLLVMDSNSVLLINLLIIAVIPAIGEELVFRGIIQRILCIKFPDPHIAILYSAIIFSAFHMEVIGFFPKLLIGLILGYTYYWTKNIWYPIVLHFINNGMQVVAVYFIGIPDGNEQSTAGIDYVTAAVCFALMILVVILLHKKYVNGESA